MRLFFSERDIEIPQLLGFVNAHSKEIATILDVGCFGSQYLKELKESGKIVDGIDVRPGGERKFLRNYFVGNALTYPLERYDLVICLSTLEHAGIEHYTVDDFMEEQDALFKKLLDTSKWFIYVSFPYGIPVVHEGRFANVTKNRLNRFLAEVISKATYEMSFYFNNRPHDGFGWTSISQNDADKIYYDPTEGVRCVCILKVTLRE